MIRDSNMSKQVEEAERYPFCSPILECEPQHEFKVGAFHVDKKDLFLSRQGLVSVAIAINQSYYNGMEHVENRFNKVV